MDSPAPFFLSPKFAPRQKKKTPATIHKRKEPNLATGERGDNNRYFLESFNVLATFKNRVV